MAVHRYLFLSFMYTISHGRTQISNSIIYTKLHSRTQISINIIYTKSHGRSQISINFIYTISHVHCTYTLSCLMVKISCIKLQLTLNPYDETGRYDF